MVFSRWMAESVKITWIYFKNAYYNMVLSTQNPPKTLFPGLFFQGKFAKIHSPKGTGRLSLNAHILLICITENIPSRIKCTVIPDAIPDWQLEMLKRDNREFKSL